MKYYVPDEMKKKNNWGYWKLMMNKDNKQTKVPINPKTLGLARTNDENDWYDYNFCVDKIPKGKVNGLSFRFKKEDNIVFIDLDHCIVDGKLTDFAKNVCSRFKNTYQELSQSGSGIHIFCKGNIDKAVHTDKIEMYDWGRYVAFTGHCINEKNLYDYSDEVKKLYEENVKKDEFIATPIQQEYNPNDINSVIENIKKSKNGYKFMELFGGMVEANSENTLSLASILAFWTQKNASMIKEIILRSGLYREKMNTARGNITWLDYVINKALASTTETYNPVTKKEYTFKSQKKEIKEIDMLGQDLYFELSQIEYKTKPKYRCLSNIHQLDRLVGGFTYDCVTLWTAQTNGGKTTMLSMIAREIIKQGHKVFYFNGEQTKEKFQNNLYKQMASKKDVYGVQFKTTDIYDYYVKPDKLKDIKKFYDYNVFVYNNDCPRDIDTILYAMKDVYEKCGVKDFIIDNLMQIEINGSDVLREQNEIMEKLRTFAVNNECNVHLVAHPKKTETNNIRVTIWDVAGTMNIANKSYNIISIIRKDQIREETLEYRQIQLYCYHQGYDFEECDCILEVLKQKEGIGSGIVGLKYDPILKTYTELAKKDMTYKIKELENEKRTELKGRGRK